MSVTEAAFDTCRGVSGGSGGINAGVDGAGPTGRGGCRAGLPTSDPLLGLAEVGHGAAGLLHRDAGGGRCSRGGGGIGSSAAASRRD